MQIFLDSANVDEISAAHATGFLDGITTNPALMAEVQKADKATDYSQLVQGIFNTVADDDEFVINLEVAATEYEEMIAQAERLAALSDKVVVKVPATDAGLKAARTLSAKGILVNVTLVFSVTQALLAAKAGAFYISPFVGRLEDREPGVGLELVAQIVDIFDTYEFETQVLFASVRGIEHVKEAALLGADAVTMPYEIFTQLAQHPMTDDGLKKFLDSWRETGWSI